MLDHIEELRKRLLYALIALIVGTAISFTVVEPILRILTIPVGGLESLQSIEITENMGVLMRVALLSGFIISMPVILYQLLVFVLPGLKPKERAWVWFTIIFGTIFFLLGVAFGYFVMLQTAVPFLTSVLGVTTVPRLSSTVNFITNLLFWLGLSFQAPLITFFLAKIKLVSAGMLIRGWRLALVIIAVLSAVITPTTDIVNMSLLMGPLFILYWLSALFAFLARRSERL